MPRLLPYLFLVVFLSVAALAQQGTITGSVHDQQTGDELVGANILIVGSSRGASTDLDGKFAIRGIEPGRYSLRISYVGYAAKVVTDVSVSPGGVAQIDVTLNPQQYQTEDVIITAERLRSTESALLSERRKAVTIGDGISAEQVKRTPDATSGDALRRVTGLSIVDNKFVFIRGITDRYNGTTLDGATVTSTEVGKKSFSFDLIPSNLIESAVVVKSATPDLPGDFTGGLVQLNTLDFPRERIVKIGLSSSYNSNGTSRDFLGSQSGSGNWLGYDDGSRALPMQNGTLTDLARSLANNWAPKTQKAPYNGSFTLLYGDQIILGDPGESESQLGMIGSISYSNSFNLTGVRINEQTSGGFGLRNQNGVRDMYSILWGAIANLSYRLSGMHKVSFKNSYNNTADDVVNQLAGTDNNTGNEVRTTGIRWTQRSVYTGQVIGEHSFPALDGAQLEWRLSVSSSVRNDPDRKFIPYVRSIGSSPEDPFYVATSDRSWERANDRNIGFGVDVTIPVEGVKAKFGTLVDEKKSDYKIRAYRINTVAGTDFNLLALPIDEVYASGHFGPGGFAFFENPSNASSFYSAEQELITAYGMMDAPFSFLGERFRVVGGARLENSTQDLYSVVSLTDPTPLKTQLRKIDVLPSMNLTYVMNDVMNLRLAYSHTLNRPEFRELAPVAYFDMDRLETVFGNNQLQRALIRNYDARFELFPGVGELVAVSYFHKDMTSPIEETIDVQSTPLRTYINSPIARNRGWEFELRKSLDFLGEYFRHFMISGNYARVYSEVEIRNEVTPGVFQTSHRPLQGQSPYMVNLAVMFTEPDLGTSVSILYNKIGRRIDAVGGSISEPDIYEEPRDLVDISVSQRIFSILDAKFSIKNLNGREEVLTRREQFYRSNSTGTSYSLSISMSL